MKRTIVSVLGALGLAALVATSIPAADAKIRSVDTSCTNKGGNQAGGQQPTCKGAGQTQQTENQNPAGKAPKGQNK